MGRCLGDRSRSLPVKVVLDTNVFVSGVFFGGTPGRVLEAWRNGKAEVVLSREIVEEYVRVGEELADRFPAVDLRPALELLAVSATLVPSPPLPESVSRDTDDDKFLACALAAGADYVVSGDRDLLDVSSYKGVVVLSPRDFVDLLR
ncbi:MAG: putative toxin-antitoxin system toxin component, PIN family [Holophagales bacterium]|nr:putative toxin-antitoxin system toxin component, PIN family [Holophagales bacterium]MYC09000.1 putative toxin-antitoxin system toxin component, PIN family [Holophagales bacterium]